jgi:hypothetical protein
VINFNIIHNPEHPIILGLPWFELDNPDIDWINQTIIRPPKNLISSLSRVMNSSPNPQHISIISLQRLRKEAKSEQIFVFTIVVMLSSSSQKSEALLPIKYQEFIDVFDKENSIKLPEHRLIYDCPLDLRLGKESPWGPIYNLSPLEPKSLREYTEEHFANRFIQHSRSLAGASIFFVKKKDDSLWLVVDDIGV